MSENIEILREIPVNTLGEGPHWDVARQQLYFVDIVGGSYHRYDPATRQETHVNLNDQIGFACPVEGNSTKFIVAQGRNFSLLDWDGSSSTATSVETLAVVDTQYPGNRLNDGKCDRQGRLWAGTMVENNEPENSGSFYRMDLTGSIAHQFGGVATSNGIAWSSGDSYMYYIDTNTRKVDSFHFNYEDGTIANRKNVIDLANTQLSGNPDGMTIDANGNLWVALWDGYKVIQVDPVVGQVIREINMPVKDITSVAFGGPNLDELYVTSASFFSQPNAGSVFRITDLGGGIRGADGGTNYKGTIPS